MFLPPSSSRSSSATCSLADRLGLRAQLITWLWVVLWGAAFVVTERDEIRFDIVYGAVAARVRRACAVAAGLVLIALSASPCRRPPTTSPS